MLVHINGEARTLGEGTTLAALAGALSIDTRKVAMEVNFSIIPRSQYGEIMLKENDQVEIVQFIGGG
jgi:thiamine biosynthesis protein ThiS